MIIYRNKCYLKSRKVLYIDLVTFLMIKLCSISISVVRQIQTNLENTPKTDKIYRYAFSFSFTAIDLMPTRSIWCRSITSLEFTAWREALFSNFGRFFVAAPYCLDVFVLISLKSRKSALSSYIVIFSLCLFSFL